MIGLAFVMVLLGLAFTRKAPSATSAAPAAPAETAPAPGGLYEALYGGVVAVREPARSTLLRWLVGQGAVETSDEVLTVTTDRTAPGRLDLGELLPRAHASGRGDLWVTRSLTEPITQSMPRQIWLLDAGTVPAQFAGHIVRLLSAKEPWPL
jgi:hypothetical protein